MKTEAAWVCAFGSVPANAMCSKRSFLLRESERPVQPLADVPKEVVMVKQGTRKCPSDIQLLANPCQT